MTTAEGSDRVSSPLISQQPAQVADESQSAFNYRAVWETFFRRAGYFPIVSSFSGPVRACIGGIGAVINAVCIPIFHHLNQQEKKKLAIENLKFCATWIVRGLVESKPFVGNALAWSWDTLNDRIENKPYLSDFLYECRFFPLVSMITGAIRTARGAAGTVIGGVAFGVLKLIKPNARFPRLQEVRETAYKFAQESLLEIPEGVIEMIPCCKNFCPSVADKAENFERKKLEIWTRPHDQ